MNVNVTSRKHFLLLSDHFRSCAEDRLFFFKLENYVITAGLANLGI